MGEFFGLKAFNLNIPDLCPVSFRRQPAVKFHLIVGEKCVSANADCEARPRGPVNLWPNKFLFFLELLNRPLFAQVNQLDFSD